MGPGPNAPGTLKPATRAWSAMASPPTTLRRRRAWVERARIGALAARILEVDRFFLRSDGSGVLSPSEAETLRSIAARMGTVEP